MAYNGIVVIGGRPGTGKTTLAKRVAGEIRAAYLRIDVIVLPMLDAGVVDEVRGAEIGYEIARGIARQNLESGVPVVVDGLNATHARRAEWVAFAAAVGARLEFFETYVADESEHRRRVVERTSGDDEFPGPSWDAIQQMAYEPWGDGERFALDMTDGDAALAAAIRRLDGAR